MFNEKHDLVHEFPEHRQAISKLKSGNLHFCKLVNDYHEIDHEVLRIETGIENSSDEYLNNQKKKRLYLKDLLLQMIKSN